MASSVTRMAFFSSSAGRRLFTVRYLLLFMCRSWWAGRVQVRSPGPGGQPIREGASGGLHLYIHTVSDTKTQTQTEIHAVTHTNTHSQPGSQVITKKKLTLF